MKPEEYPRLVISGGLLLLFSYAYVRNPSDQLVLGAVINMAGMAAQYWLGSSRGTVEANARTDKAIDLAKENQK